MKIRPWEQAVVAADIVLQQRVFEEGHVPTSAEVTLMSRAAAIRRRVGSSVITDPPLSAEVGD